MFLVESRSIYAPPMMQRDAAGVQRSLHGYKASSSLHSPRLCFPGKTLARGRKKLRFFLPLLHLPLDSESSSVSLLWRSVVSLPVLSEVMSFRMTNASSGMGVAEHSKNTFQELQRKKVHRYVVFKIDEGKKEVLVEKTGAPGESYADFTASLPENDCRYAVYDFDFVTEDNCQKSKIFFISWSPDVSRIRAKMLYATSKDRFRRELEGVHYELQATEPTELDLEVLRDRAN
ncbi:hypothetical protein HPP92_028353 [Vanilla planifolia]|uniref:ADF-H domain-containing protein n=1 Tax=Vanilla planifolia TaxID=51239 RepID=A0A835P8W4_VANPL|nr:hypothetical protein HPP92_028353 [Vanilla planifolia]